MPSEAFDFPGPDGRSLSGRLDLPEGPVRAHALFAHCFTCSKTSLAAVRIARALTELGVGVLRFDFTGLGDSPGDLAISGFTGNVADLVAASRAMAAAGRAPELLIGHSLGGAAALAAAAEMDSVTAVAAIGAPFDVAHVTRLFADSLSRIEDEGQAQVSLGGRPVVLSRAFLEDLRRQDQGARIEALRRALLILHSPIDQIVGVENAQSIFLAARHPKSFISLDRTDHLLTRPGDAEYAASVIAAWAGRYLPVPTPRTTGATPREGDGGITVEDTGVGRFQMRVTGLGPPLLADEPVAVGGLDSGPAPYDLVSAGLGACTAMTLKGYAVQKDWPLSHIKVRVGHAKVAGREPPDVFTRELTLEGGLSEDQRARLLEVAGRCPVHRTLERGSSVETTLAAPPTPDAS